ncbi:MAG: hypothetical protein QOG10_6498 [Kribbellaceae bacterium]|jgi:uncharacterized protein YukE|nr:hypothetical protein [Kribbellaceae bacterium]
MNAMVGGSLPEMDALKTKLDAFKTELGQLKTASTKVVTSTTWKGKYADDFRAAWEQCQKNITNIETDLNHAATAVQKNRQAIAAATGS